MQAQRVPPTTAYLGLACYRCFKEQRELSGGAELKKCSQCRRVSYCSPVCQKGDWAQHKTFCKALFGFENNPGTRAITLFSLADAVHEDLDSLNFLIEERALNEAKILSLNLHRTLTTPELNLIGWEPRCIACGQSDRLIRMVAAEKNRTGPVPMTRPCPSCQMTYYCSEEHCNAMEHRHRNTPDKDGHDGLSQCQLQQEMRQDIRVANVFAMAQAGQFQWAPERTLASWQPLEGTTWNSEYSDGLTEFSSIPGLTKDIIPALLRASSDALSYPLTILWALEHLNGEDLSWTRKKTLTVHVANQNELLFARTFEEILHRLPDVKHLKLILCGPELSTVDGNDVIEMETCPECNKNGRSRTHQHFWDFYHIYASNLGQEYKKPDLAVAFNSGLSENSTEPWRQTINFLLEHHVPSVFTSYNSIEAMKDAEVIAKAGAILHSNLGPIRNPWGSILCKKEPNRVTGFYSVNGWLAGGFSG
ncbi:hypothetical protein BDN72DRAFT_776554 [Pluteus cervinus]|uniref:Uncharacterized protein n=1 Tax=Pluteus cervinus TaxID=181527 RepID=A0ACD3ABI6_9AGAR|nr:hypothetical protein BDN72DRAFT_776554 [Pluteus cervinus]